MPTRSLQDFLSTADGTARFAAHAQRLLRIQQLFEANLPTNLHTQMRVANLRQGKLVIHAANSAVAAKLRQMAPRLAELVIKDGAKLTEIDVRVQARRLEPPRHHRNAVAPPSEERKQALTDMAVALPAGDPLKAPLEALLRVLKAR